ncbi:MAG: glutamine--tRNA ligase/YqeY domain fusion protein [Candidatus Delongbacteria bacterium]|nr:glutamine--tRNA ligase/YqeY domain fusion protein [Candidatus Delongbacteria bacterium]MBN2836093.1 glutamine--tRNA ligase/YqeY domain fusion protein [Candidatus Delongbacteria bacterium]
MEIESTKPMNFIRKIVEEDLKSGKHTEVHTRFPPEPSGYLHIGHAKAICADFGIAADYNGKCNLRMDDTNPSKESMEYSDSIQNDIKWLGFDWEDRLFFASDYFETLYGFAVDLVKKGLAYVCDLSFEEMRAYRGTLTETGKDSPFRNRSVEENLDLLKRMRDGEFEDGSKTLRAKIDMSSPIMVMRDPAIYRIKRVHHHRTGDSWCIYPMYDFAHCLSDAIEGVTHSMCTLEFQDNRVLYDWFVEKVGTPAVPKQYEFARLNISHTITSKRKLLALVEGKFVDGWDDPRMPTLCGLRRRGVAPEAIRTFMEKLGLGKQESVIHISQFDYDVRENLKKNSPRVFGVLNPLKIVIDNYPENKVEMIEASYNSNDPEAKTRMVPFSKEVYIEQEDFKEEANKKFFRLVPGREVRLRFAYNVVCTSVEKDENGNILCVHCDYDPQSGDGGANSGKKIKGILHWVSAKHAIDAEVRLYDNLFTVENPGALDNFTEYINPESLTILKNCKLEPSLKDAEPESRWQFERMGYFCRDIESNGNNYVFNRTLTLKDNYGNNEKV